MNIHPQNGFLDCKLLSCKPQELSRTLGHRSVTPDPHRLLKNIENIIDDEKQKIFQKKRGYQTIIQTSIQRK